MSSTCRAELFQFFHAQMNNIMSVTDRKNYRIATAQKAIVLRYEHGCVAFDAVSFILRRRHRHLYERNPDLYDVFINNPGLMNEGVHETLTTNQASLAMTKISDTDQALKDVVAKFHHAQFANAGAAQYAMPVGESGGLGLFGTDQPAVVETAVCVVADVALALKAEGASNISADGRRRTFNSPALSLGTSPVCTCPTNGHW
jgi:hypothetical protein